MKNRTSTRLFPIEITILASLIVVLSACAAPSTEENLVGISAPTEELMAEEPTPSPEPTDNPFGNWSEYQNDNFGFRFLYPTSWFGPEVSESEGSLRVEVGSDQVYPYGTSREDQITSLPDSYYILIQYVENTEGRSWDDFISSGWIDTYLALQEKEDRQYILTPRLAATRIGEVKLGEFSGLIYLATLPDTAQTERAYIREAVLFDSELNWLRISGFPNLVQIEDPENWKNDYARVDQSYLETFLTTLESIEFK